MQEGSLLWEPPEELRERSDMARFMRERGCADYAELWRWSVADLEGFWASIWDRYGVAGGYERVLREPSSTTTLVAAIRKRVREDCSPRHVPSEIQAIAEVPRTLSGKVLEVPVKRILMGEPPERAASRDSLANPAALDHFVALAAASDYRRGQGWPVS